MRLEDFCLELRYDNHYSEFYIYGIIIFNPLHSISYCSQPQIVGSLNPTFRYLYPRNILRSGDPKRLENPNIRSSHLTEFKH